jgi:hypothetical protein
MERVLIAGQKNMFPEAGLEIIRSSFVVDDLIKLISVRVGK